MAKNTEFSVYELGIIKNSLRDRIVNLEDLKADNIINDDDIETNVNIETFSLELMNIKDKIRVMIDNKTNDNCL